MVEKRWGQSSHDHMRTNNVAMQSRRDDGFEKFNNKDGQSPCTMCTMMSTPCSDSQTRRRTIASGRRDDNLTPTPSACTCNNVFFNMWSACLYSNGNSTLPLYTNWGAECQKNSLQLKDGYPKQWADKIAIPDWARIEIPNTSKFDIDKAIQITKTSNPWGLPQIIVPIAAVLGTLVFGSAIFGFYRLKGSKKGSSPLKFTHWLSPRKSLRVRQARHSDAWSIDRNDESEEYVMVDVDDEPRGAHVRFPSMEDVEDVKSVNFSNAEYQFPLKSIWKKSQIAQQIRRLPGQIPLPWKERPIQITSRPPGKRFRVDSLNTSTESGGTGDPNSRSGTAEGGAGRPDTIFETEEYPVANDRNSIYENEGTSLISHSERDSNRVFLITHRPGDFTLESGSSNQNSSTSHQLVNIVPPTPTESSRLSQRHNSAVPPPPMLDPPPRRPALPPAPRQPAPFPPGISPPTPRGLPTVAEQGSRQAGPSAPPTPQPHTLHPQIVSSESLPLTPGSKRHDLPPATHVRRQPSKEDNDSLKRPLPVIRPIGARLPSSPGQVARQLSLDELSQNLSPSVQSIGDTMYTVGSPPHSPRPLTPSSHHRALSGDVLFNHGGSLATPRPQHSRNVSMESLVPARGDPVMLFPGSVRGAGYTIGLPPEETESSASLYSTTSSGNPRSSPGPAQSRVRAMT